MIKKKFNNQIKILQLVNIIMSVVGIVYLCLNFSLLYFCIAIAMFLLFGIFGVNVGYHRYFSHRSFKTWRIFEVCMAFIGTLASLGSVISWVALHRYHHLTADTEKDPHSPKFIGNWNAYTYNWKRADISRKFIKDLMHDNVILFLHRHYFKVIFLFIALLGIINPILIIFAYCIPATGCLNGVAAVTVIGHIHGYVSHKVNDTSKNSWIATIFSLGEGWHNNHHARPYNWRQGEQWWEIDPPCWVIKLIRKS